MKTSKKKTIALALAASAFCGAVFAHPPSSDQVVAATTTVTANPSTHKVYVDGERVNVAAYNIGGNNYFKLRDIAAVISGTPKQFEVGWDGTTNAISLTSNKPYTSVGGELASIPNGRVNAKVSTAKVYKDGAKMDYAGYNIGNNNFYKLRDVTVSFGIGIRWDGTTMSMYLTTRDTESGSNSGQEPEKVPEQGQEPIVDDKYSYCMVDTDWDDVPDVKVYVGADGIPGTDDDFYLDENGNRIAATITMKKKSMRPFDLDGDGEGERFYIGNDGVWYTDDDWYFDDNGNKSALPAPDGDKLQNPRYGGEYCFEWLPSPLPPYNENSKVYKKVLESFGEEIVTVKYKVLFTTGKKDDVFATDSDIEMFVWAIPSGIPEAHNHFEHGYLVKRFVLSADNNTFTIDMPKSVYDCTVNHNQDNYWLSTGLDESGHRLDRIQSGGKEYYNIGGGGIYKFETEGMPILMGAHEVKN